MLDEKVDRLLCSRWCLMNYVPPIIHKLIFDMIFDIMLVDGCGQ